MRHHDHSLVPEHPADAVLEDVFPDVGVHSGEHVVEQVHVSLSVHRAGQGHTLLLPAGEVDADRFTMRSLIGRYACMYVCVCGNDEEEGRVDMTAPRV